jgi:hypothetical protein
MALEFSLAWGEVPSDDFVPNVARELGWSTSKEILSEISTWFGFKESVDFLIYSVNAETDLCIKESARSFCWRFTLRLDSQFDPDEGTGNMLRYAIKSIGQLRSTAVLHFQYETVYFLINEDKKLIISSTLWDDPQFANLLDCVVYRKEDLKFSWAR